MKKNITNMALAVSFAVFSAFSVQAEDDLRADSQQAVADFLKTDSTLQTFFDKSAGYVIFPDVGKGGFIVGGAHGKGLVYQKTKLIGQATLTQASVGAQVGGQTFAELIFFETPAALEDFKGGKFEMSAEVSAVAAAEGASKSADYKKGVAVFTLPKKGLMVSASIGGQKFKYEAEVPQPTGREESKNK
jgi:lipid-binding SYLF domain-containing protein